MSSQSLSISRSRSDSPWIARILFLFLCFSGGLLTTLLFAILFYQILYLDKVYLGVTMGGVDVSGLRRSEVEAVVARQAHDYLSRPVTLTDGQQQWTFTVGQLGARIDVRQTADRVYAVGRTGSLLRDVRLHASLLGRNLDVEPVFTFDTGPANSALAELAHQIERPTRDARLVIQPDLRVEATPAEVGRRLDVDAMREQLYQAVLRPGSPPILLKIDEIPPRITEVEGARHAAETLLSQPLTFSFNAGDGAKSWSIAPDRLVRMMHLSETEDDRGVGRIALSLDRQMFLEFFTALALEIEQPVLNAWFDRNPDTGELTVLKPSQEGRTLDVARALEMVAALPGQPSNHLELPVVIQPPAVPMENPEALGITDMWSSATTYFKGSSAGRIQNIQVAAESFHGVVIPPGAIFSFNELVGDITADEGYEESLIIRGDRTAVGIGGGVCQVSTTAFRAAFYGGFEIVERWAHGYRVSWYETGSFPGLDATIYTPNVDFKFRNDTDSYILIQTRTDPEAGTVAFDFYGKPNHREVIVDGPYEANVVPHDEPLYEEDPSLPPGKVVQVDWAKDGVDVTVNRIVKENGVVIREDSFFSRYRPWRSVYRVGPGAVE